MPACDTVYFCLADSPLGALLLAGDGTGLRRLSLQRGLTPTEPEPHWRPFPSDGSASHPVALAVAELAEYFAGQRTRFTVPVAPQGTRFQGRVWAALQTIAFGETISYGELARVVGQPGAARAVGSANGKNPIPIVIPCHRVVRAGGQLGGFSCGLEFKEQLLALER